MKRAILTVLILLLSTAVFAQTQKEYKAKLIEGGFTIVLDEANKLEYYDDGGKITTILFENDEPLAMVFELKTNDWDVCIASMETAYGKSIDISNDGETKIAIFRDAEDEMMLISLFQKFGNNCKLIYMYQR